jgi:pimeloyl-ACP methyl ester carboxylesterase
MTTQPNIVLVHGAWADGTSWSPVIKRLQAAGYNVTAPQFPETSLAVAMISHPDEVAQLIQTAAEAVR